jgi:hypothetical protein
MGTIDCDASLSGLPLGALLRKRRSRAHPGETFGEATSFGVVSVATPGVTRQYHNFSEAFADVENARVFGGIHFRTSTTDGTSLGIAVADYVMENALLPKQGRGRGEGHHGGGR